MEPFIALVAVSLALFAAGSAGVRRLKGWPIALRGGLAALFVMTGVAHFVGLRSEIISMVPPAIPAPGLVVTVTGVLELAGAVGLLWTRTAPWTAGALSIYLVAVFPANVYAALEHQSSAFSDQLIPRTLMQIVFLAATLAVFGEHLRSRRIASRAAH